MYYCFSKQQAAAGCTHQHPPLIPLWMHRAHRIPTQALKTPRRPRGHTAKPVYELRCHDLSWEVTEFLLSAAGGLVVGQLTAEPTGKSKPQTPCSNPNSGASSCSPSQGSPVQQVAPTASSCHSLPTSHSLWLRKKMRKSNMHMPKFKLLKRAVPKLFGPSPLKNSKPASFSQCCS